MKRTISSLLCFLFLLGIVAKEQYFKHLGLSDGLSQVCILSLYQDELGAVWMGTTEGLNRYNGKDLKIYRPSQDSTKLTKNEISELCGDGKGTMYIRSGNDLVQLDLYKEEFTCLRRGDVKGLFCAEDTLWVTCKNGVYYYTKTRPELTLVTLLEEEVKRGEALYVDKKNIWVVTLDYLVAISRENHALQEKIVSLNRGRCISGDSDGNIWVGSWNGLYRISPNRKVTHYQSQAEGGDLSDSQVRCVLEDDFKNIWVGTFRGLDSYNPVTGEWEHYTRYGNSSNTLSHSSVLSLCKDMQSNIWVGTYYGGVNMFNPNKATNRFYSAEPLQEDCLSFPVVGKMAEDNNGNLWICTEGGGLNCYHADTKKFTRYQHRKEDPNSIGSDNLKSIYYRKENNRLYVGTHLGGLFVLDLESNKGRTFHPVKGDRTSLPHEIVNDIQAYKNGLALLTQGGPVFMDPVTEKFTPLLNDAKIWELASREYLYETFLIDSKDRMWMALTMGGVICIHLPSGEVTRYTSESSLNAAVGKFKIVHIFEDSAQEVYFSTIGSGVFKYNEKDRSFKSYSTSNQLLPSDYCYYICESIDSHRLFFLHGKGITVYNKDKREVENTYHLFNQTYSQGSALFRVERGSVFISGTNGLAIFQERSLKALPAKNFLNFDKLLIFNKEVVPNDGSGILTDILARTSDIYLNFKQNNVTIEFATFSYNNDRNCLFEYRMDGLDKVWTQTNGTLITYTSLPPGDYTLRVRVLESKQIEAKEISLKLHISAPFYATIWAYLIYFICLSGLLLTFIRFKMRQAALKSSLEFERKEKERIEELNQVKLRFFTNISHEFRTPLTLILGQIEALMQMDKLGSMVHNRILRIYKNAWHMRNLISELLDFRKQEQGYLKLKVEEQNLVPFTRQIYLCFYEYAQNKEITYRFMHLEDTVSAWFDSKQLQKVIFNLLSNAFKYTSNKGSITVEVRKVASQAVVIVSDTGSGISQEHLSKIFDRFYQTDTTSFTTLGTGIGLALAKGIMTMHHGTIDVESEIGKGAKFTLSLPLGNRHFSDEEMASTEGRESAILPEIASLPFYSTPIEEAVTNAEFSEEENKPVILLVEDHEELLLMLKEIFSPMYEVYIAYNGREGWEMVQQIQPDLIVSDVMMPEMSGKELCYRIKTNVELSHISVVLLTAQTSVEYAVEGFMFGADDYVTKPFNVKVLVARCNNLLNNKKRLMSYYAGKVIMETPALEAVNERDKEFLAKCVSIVKTNFENLQFDVTMLASELCMGRSKLYMEFKGITGLTPNEFILKVKLDEAMYLLNNHFDLNISEISMRLGFSSPRYFSKSFKAFFGVTPQSVRSKKK